MLIEHGIRRLRIFATPFIVVFLAVAGCGPVDSPGVIGRQQILSGQNIVTAKSPRDGGYFDMASVAHPVLAVNNISHPADQNVVYDFQLFSENSVASLMTGGSAAESVAERYTSFAPSLSLEPGGQYFWRARAVIDGLAGEFGAMFSFTVANFCEIEADGWAKYVTGFWHIRNSCDDVITHNDPTEALGYTDAGGSAIASDNDPLHGFISMDGGAYLELEMGATVQDSPGYDIRIYQYISDEPVELLAANSEIGPWLSLGARWCVTLDCDFDLADAGLKYARFFRIRDLSTPAEKCHSTYGADIDAIEWLDPISGSLMCQG